MDEYFSVEQQIGQINGLISMQYSEDPTDIDPSTIVYHQFPKPEPVAEKVKKPVEGDDEEAAAEEQPAEEGEQT